MTSCVWAHTHLTGGHNLYQISFKLFIHNYRFNQHKYCIEEAKYFLKQSRGFNFDPIDTKLGTDVDLSCR